MKTGLLQSMGSFSDVGGDFLGNLFVQCRQTRVFLTLSVKHFSLFVFFYSKNRIAIFYFVDNGFEIILKNLN
jgi:hypothetical protein